MQTKTCTKCKLTLDISNFNKQGKYYKSMCKKCSTEYNRKYQLKYEEKQNRESKTVKVICINNDKIYDSINECCQDLNIIYQSIYRSCNSDSLCIRDDKFYKILYLEEYNKMTQDQIQEIKNILEIKNTKPVKKSRTKKVINLDTKIVYDSVTAAAKASGLTKQSVSKACKKSSDNLENENLSKWMYLEDYLKLM